MNPASSQMMQPALESFEREASKLNHELNVIMKDGLKNSTNIEQNQVCVSRVNTIFKTILSNLLPHFGREHIARDTWILNTHLDFIPNQICLLASCQAPIRSLAVITRPRADDLAIDVIPELQYNVHKLEMKVSKRNGKRTLVVTKLKPGRMCTTRRGWYAVHKDVFNEKLEAENINGNLHIRGSQMARLRHLFDTHVDGMTRRPHDTFPRAPADINIEQFMLGKYPTPEWKAHVNDDTAFQAKCEEEEALSTQVCATHKRPRSPPAPPAEDIEAIREGGDGDGDEESCNSRLTLNSSPDRPRKRARRHKSDYSKGLEAASRVYIDEDGNCIGNYDLASWPDSDACLFIEENAQASIPYVQM